MGSVMRTACAGFVAFDRAALAALRSGEYDEAIPTRLSRRGLCSFGVRSCPCGTWFEHMGSGPQDGVVHRELGPLHTSSVLVPPFPGVLLCLARRTREATW